MKNLQALWMELYDTSYRQKTKEYDTLAPYAFGRSIRKTYFHAGRYAQGARDTNAVLAWAEYLAKENE